jgi:hypothetical protein
MGQVVRVLTDVQNCSVLMIRPWVSHAGDFCCSLSAGIDVKLTVLTFNARIKSLRATVPDKIFLLGIVPLEPCISLIYAWKTNKYTNYTFSLLCMVALTRACFGITLQSSGSVPGAFWETFNYGAVDRILWMGVLCLVTWCACAQYSIDCSSIEHLSEGTRNAPWRWQCNAETCSSYHT